MAHGLDVGKAEACRMSCNVLKHFLVTSPFEMANRARYPLLSTPARSGFDGFACSM